MGGNIEILDRKNISGEDVGDIKIKYSSLKNCNGKSVEHSRLAIVILWDTEHFMDFQFCSKLFFFCTPLGLCKRSAFLQFSFIFPWKPLAFVNCLEGEKISSLYRKSS